MKKGENQVPDRDSRSQNDLKQASFHLNYELNMLFISRVALTNARNNEPTAIKNAYLLNAILESFLIHARNLIDFFYSNSRYSDDVVAEDFIYDWRTQEPTATDLLNDTRTRANKHLVH